MNRGMHKMNLHVIYTRDDRVLLSRRHYDGWQEIQAEIDDYMTSLGPWSADEMIDYLDSEYPRLASSARQQVEAFLSSSEPVVVLRFTPRG
jgi:hypothetical protein